MPSPALQDLQIAKRNEQWNSSRTSTLQLSMCARALLENEQPKRSQRSLRSTYIGSEFLTRGLKPLREKRFLQLGERRSRQPRFFRAQSTRSLGAMSRYGKR